uniref:Uncharacterized protein n=1 Tax=Amphimedon queenslandica TaxID=400682 RepID=A0A1X7SWL9_AMPQE
YGDTALIAAAEGGNCDVVELLLKKGADLSDSNNLLNCTCNLFKQLEKSLDVYYKSHGLQEGYTALIEAADRGHYDIVQLLLNNGADQSTANDVSIM